MTTNDINFEEKIRQLDERHQDDGDGGYRLLNAILEYESQLAPQQSSGLREKLVDLVASHDQELWGVALEAIVQRWDRQISHDLASLISRRKIDDEWGAHIVLALLRLKYSPIQEQALDFVKGRLSAGDRTVLPWLAALSNIDADGCASLAAGFFVAEYHKGELDKSQGYVPAFVRNFVEVDRTILFDVIGRICKSDRAAAKETVLIFLDYIRKPFFVKEFGQELSNDLEAGMKSVLAV